jgi:outer membrane cobalamin receptor
MTKITIFISTLATALLMAACSGPQPSVDKQDSPFYDNSVVIFAQHESFSLANLLRQLPGVRVAESLRSTTVYVRGGQPLFIVDGVRMGHDFNEVIGIVTVQDVTAIELLRDPTETMIYGPGTQHGVIIIHTTPLEWEENQ